MLTRPAALYIRLLLCLALSLAQTPSSAQVDQEEVERLIDESVDAEEVDGGDLERLSDVRAYTLLHPLPVNTANAGQLASLQLLTPLQIDALLEYRRLSGPLLDLVELQAVPGFELADVRTLLPYLSLSPGAQVPQRLLRRWKDGTAFLSLRTAYQSDDEALERWRGSPLPFYLRLRKTAGRQFSVGVIAENDAGERFAGRQNPLLFDYVSAHAYADELRGTLETVALGDFGVNWGQGLINYSGFAGGKGAYVMDVQRNARWLIPHASVSEAGFYRGAAAKLASGSWSAMVLGSRLGLDGSLDTLGDGGDRLLSFGTFRQGGLHRTESEIAGRRANSATSFGGAVQYDAPWGNVSLHYLEHRFRVPFAAKDRLYQRFEFTGDRMRNASLAWQTFLGSISWFGEAALDGLGAGALISGVQTGIDRRTDLAVVYRDYGLRYRTLYPNVFGASRRPDNERGLYAALRTELSDDWTAQVFYDLYQHPYARFRLSRPSLNQDALFRASFERRRSHRLYLQIRHRRSERDLPRDESGTLRTLRPFVRSSLRLQAELRLTEAVTLRTRAEGSRVEAGGTLSYGTILYQDVLLRPTRGPLSATARIALVDTDDYESRIYAFENDLLYRFRIPAYFGRGYRSYLNVRYKASPRLSIEGRVAHRRRVGAVDRVELSTQLRYEFD